MPKPPKRDQLVEATKELLWQVGYEDMSPRDRLPRGAGGKTKGGDGRLEHDPEKCAAIFPSQQT